MAGDGLTAMLGEQAKNKFIQELIQAIHQHHLEDYGPNAEGWPLVCGICDWKIREDEVSNG